MDAGRLLYVTALPGAETPSGRSMRTAMVLYALRQHYQVSVASPEHAPDASSGFDVVHVFRLAALSLAKPYLASAGQSHLDLDDIESKTHRRIEALCRANGHLDRADYEHGESLRSQMLETLVFRSFHRIYICSEADRAELAPRCQAELLVLPNVVPLPVPLEHPPRRDPSEPFRFLFIGSMGYYPNSDACNWFCREVLPILERRSPKPFSFDIAGAGSPDQWRNRPKVRFWPDVPDVRPLYEAADAAVVPLRAGGGTRIKILEAFSYRRPVISTTIGAEGLSVTPGHDILIGDTAESFANCCLTLMNDPGLAPALTKNAFTLVDERYSPATLARILAPPSPQ